MAFISRKRLCLRQPTKITFFIHGCYESALTGKTDFRGDYLKYFHGAGRRGPYFEGWYLKHQSPDGETFAAIPALHIDGAGHKSASLQVITQEGSWSFSYPSSAPHACTDFFQVWLDGNLFNSKGVWLSLKKPGLEVLCEVRYGPFTPLRSDIMGPFRLVPGMQCNHGVVSMGHRLEGSITINGRAIDFTGGTGYIESDWGRSFPKRYLWTQCTWREARNSSLMLSIADIPFPGGSFTGCICAVLHGGREYRLATYLGAKVEHWTADGAVIRQGPYQLIAELVECHPLPLRAPSDGEMTRTIHESLHATVRYRFLVDNELLFDRVDQRASFEFAPDLV